MDSDIVLINSLFKSDPSLAIEKCKNIICSVSQFESFDDFYSYYLKNLHTSSCKTEWSTMQISVFCRECANSDESCICLDCYLNGNHEGHNILIQKSSGNCDCGNTLYWKKSGFCSKHSGHNSEEEHPEYFLDEKLRNILTDVIFKTCFNSLKQYSTDGQENASTIIDFVSSFLELGDGFQRLISISFTERYDIKGLMNDIIEYGSDFNESLEQFCGLLINDELFLKNFSTVLFDVISNKLIEYSINEIICKDEKNSYLVWDNFIYFIFSEKIYRYNIEKFNFDWTKFALKSSEYITKILDYVGTAKTVHFPDMLLTIILYLKNATSIQPNEQTQFFFDNLVEQILSRKNLIYLASFKEYKETNHYMSIHFFKHFFYDIFWSFQTKPNLKYDKLFELLDKELNISPIWMIGKKDNLKESDQFISRFIIEKESIEFLYFHEYYQSFHNGSSFFINCPLYDSFVELFKVDWISRIKIAQILSNEKYQSLRIKLGIITIKSYLSFICNYLSIVPGNNKGLSFFYKFRNQPTELSKSYTKLIPVLQLLIGLEWSNHSFEFCLKEFFAFEIAHELGIFDDFSSVEYNDENVNEKEKQMIFGFLYISLMIVIERVLFNYNEKDFIKEQIIFALKKGVHSIEMLSKMYDDEVTNSWSIPFTFDEILMKYSKKNDKNDKETLFYLKDEIDWNPISAVNSIIDQMVLMNNEISKDSDKLLKIPDFESEETYFFKKTSTSDDSNDSLFIFNHHELNKIKLKEFLITPTVLAVIYYTLRMNADEGLQNSDLNDHLAMNILVLISKFIDNEDNLNNCSFNELNTIHYESLTDLIDKLRRVVFNYHVDESGNAFIEQTLNKQNFISLIKMKISSDKKNEKSFIDLLLQRGKLGNDVLNEISLNLNSELIEKSDTGDVESKTTDVKEKNHLKAKKLKEQIMKQYKDAITSYSNSNNHQAKETDSIDDNEMLNSNQEVCSICSSIKNNEISSFPLYIYRTKLPFIIDKPPLVSIEVPGIPIDDNTHDFDLIKKEEEEHQHENEEENHENEGESNENEGENHENEGESNENEGENHENEEENHENEEENHENEEENHENEEESNEEEEEEENLDSIIEQFRLIAREREEDEEQKRIINERIRFQKEENEELRKEKKDDQFKRCTIGANFVLQFSICHHSVHPSCVKHLPFTCPIDRTIKNSLLPSLDSIPKPVILNKTANDTEISLTNSAVNSINSFIANFASFFDCIELQPLEIFIELVKSISALISTYEIRLRSLPDCLDSDKTILLSRNLFLTVWYGYRIKGKPKMTNDIESKLTSFQLFVKKLIEFDEIDEIEFTDFVSSFIKNHQIEDEKRFFIFLRRCCLSEHFLLKKNVSINDSKNDLIDWDVVLSISNLSNRYNLKFSKSENIELGPFTFLKFPKEFLRFYQSPFEFPIEKVKSCYAFNALDYNYLIDHYDDINGEIVIDDIEKEKKKNKKNLFKIKDNFTNVFLKTFCGARHSPSIIIQMAKFASEIILVDGNNFALLETFYVDKFGCTDINYKRSQLLYFSEERYEKFVENLLSGDFAYSLKNG